MLTATRLPHLKGLVGRDAVGGVAGLQLVGTKTIEVRRCLALGSTFLTSVVGASGSGASRFADAFAYRTARADWLTRSPDVMAIAEMVADLLGHPKKQVKSWHGVAPAALKAYDVAVGVSRARFYELLKVDQELNDNAITVGTQRLWPIVFLDHWLTTWQKKKIESRQE